MIALISLFTLGNACKKEIKSISDTDKPEITSKAKKDPNGKYAGPCPYDCDDLRCAYYSEPNPDCVTGGVPENIALITNTNNPVDYIGQQHNDGMISIMPYYEGGNVEPTQQNVFLQTKSYVLTVGMILRPL